MVITIFEAVPMLALEPVPAMLVIEIPASNRAHKTYEDFKNVIFIKTPFLMKLRMPIRRHSQVITQEVTFS